MPKINNNLVRESFARRLSHMENELKLKDVKRYWYNNNNIMDPNS